MNRPNILRKADTNRTSNLAQSTTDMEELLAIPIGELFIRSNTSQSGLTSQGAEQCLEIYGYNELAKRKKRTTIIGFPFHFRSPLLIILLVAGLISGFLGEKIDPTIIFSIVLLSVGLDFYQESRAEKAAVVLFNWGRNSPRLNFVFPRIPPSHFSYNTKFSV